MANIDYIEDEDPKAMNIGADYGVEGGGFGTPGVDDEDATYDKSDNIVKGLSDATLFIQELIDGFPSSGNNRTLAEVQRWWDRTDGGENTGDTSGGGSDPGGSDGGSPGIDDPGGVGGGVSGGQHLK